MEHPGRPFHSGEREAQRRAGVAREAEEVGGIVSPFLSPSVARFLRMQSLAVAATLDDRGRPWASLLTGRPGFLAVEGDRLLAVAATPSAADPLSENLRGRPELALLVLNPATRQRIRVNGRGRLTPEGLSLEPDQVYGNCPKYIQKRRLLPEDAAPEGGTGPGGADGAGTVARASSLGAREREWIAGADTFFIASFHPRGGADASHRGGRPGFVRVVDDRRLAFDDYPGNNMFNTLGNLLEYPRSGLLFLDFSSGDVLQLTARAEVRFGGDRREIRFEVEDAITRDGATRLRWELLESSPANPPIP